MVKSCRISFNTRGNAEIKDITEEVQNIIASSGIDRGIVTVSIPGATGALTTLEYEPGLIEDLTVLLKTLVPENRNWKHNSTHSDLNGHSHLRASLIGPSLSLPIEDGRIVLGTWQQIIFIDYDNRPRERELVVMVVGE